MVAPVAAAPGVAARSRQVIKPSSALRPSVQKATQEFCAIQNSLCSSVSAATKGTTSSKTAFDCHSRREALTPHRTVPASAAGRVAFSPSKRLFINALASTLRLRAALPPALSADLQSSLEAGHIE